MNLTLAYTIIDEHHFNVQFCHRFAVNGDKKILEGKQKSFHFQSSSR